MPNEEPTAETQPQAHAELPSPDDQPPAQPFLVVGVGASAGGLEAFRQMLEPVPADPGMAFLYVQHLDPNAKSLLPDILQRATALPVREATEGMRVEVNHVYLIPPNMSMALLDGHLTLTPRPAGRIPHMPADYLFRSLADIQKERAVGVILSGGGSDGTLGFQAIKAHGGITFAQDEKTARHAGMPRSAVADGHVDYILSPADISRRLLQLADHPYTAGTAEAAVPPAGQAALADILGLLRTGTGVDFTQYKRSTILRRVHRRMALRGLEDFNDYFRYLEENPAEQAALYQDFLIRVTRFFRDEGVFDAVKEKVFPTLIRDRTPNTPIRAWVVGCSTGEEVYSLAICLLEFLGERHSNVPVKLLATDVNEAALEKARAGVYLDNIELDVSPERLRRFFAKVNGHYQVSKAVRDLCIFSRHNLVGDPPFSHLDLVSCRNLLIYLDASLQKRVLPVLHYALNPGCFLLLGSSESVGPFADLFIPVDVKHRIYAKNPSKHAALALDLNAYTGALAGGAVRPVALPAQGWTALDVQKEADRVLLSRYAPVGVVIDDNMTVLQFRGRTGPYLEPAPGLASLDLLKMLREGLLAEVRGAINRARAENVVARAQNIPLKDLNQTRLVTVEVIPMRVPPSGVRCFLVLFHDSTPAPAAPPGPPASEAATPGPEGLGAEGSGERPRSPSPSGSAEAARPAVDPQVTQLQQELAATREYLQSLIEEHESACEELKSASEELLSANEELQSTNEELQTAKEETQSANEELATLNDELHHRNGELAQANNDLINFLSAVNIAIVLVSRDLRIRRFTPVAEKVLNLIPTDVARPITDINTNLNLPDLAGLIAKVIDTLTPLETEVQDRDGHWYSVRIRPYVTIDNKIEGASVALVDIDRLRRQLQSAPEKPA